MATTTAHRGNRQTSGPATYLCWSHDNNRMEMTDLPGYLDSLQRSYDSVQQAYTATASAIPTATAWGVPATSDRPRSRGHRHRHGEDHDQACRCDRHDPDAGHRRHQGECGCGSTPSRHCETCIEDADIVVYAHCGEVRVVPIEIENDTRTARKDVSLDISDIRTAGGRVLPWSTTSTVQGPLVLEACTTTSFQILVGVDCRTGDPVDGKPDRGRDDPATNPAKGDQKAAVGGSRDVDAPVVGYFTVRLGGCLTRPVVVAVAALPYSCNSYRTGCACASCC